MRRCFSCINFRSKDVNEKHKKIHQIPVFTKLVMKQLLKMRKCFSCINFRSKDVNEKHKKIHQIPVFTKLVMKQLLKMRRCFSCINFCSKDVKNCDDDDDDMVLVDNGVADSTITEKMFTSQRCSEAHSLTFRELAIATENFKDDNLIGEGGFGCVYKGRLESGKIVAVKQLNLNGHQGNQEFMVEVVMLSRLHHSNLVTLTGFCADGDQRLLVYEYMPLGSLESHLFDLEPDKEPMDWHTRLKVAVGAARGLEYLHCKANPPVIYRDLKSSNILLDGDFNPKLSDFGLAKLGPVGDNTHVSTRVMGTHGYCAPEYLMTGHLTIKSDIYSFGVILLELVTGRKAIDKTKKPGEQNLVPWARPFLRDRKKFVQLVDPLLHGRFSERSVCNVVALAAMCLQQQANFRPLIGDIVVALEYLASQAESFENHKSLTVQSQPSPAKQDEYHARNCPSTWQIFLFLMSLHHKCQSILPKWFATYIK